jgi:hypothetical protein
MTFLSYCDYKAEGYLKLTLGDLLLFSVLMLMGQVWTILLILIVIVCICSEDDTNVKKFFSRKFILENKDES